MSILWAPWRLSYIQSNPEKKSNCIFCDKLACANDRDELILFRGEHAFLMMNLYPYNNGHLLVAPYAHLSSLEELPAHASADLMLVITKGLSALRRAVNPHGFNVGANLGEAAGAGVAGHVHFHIVPRWSADTNFVTVTGGTRVIPESLEATYDRLLLALQEL